MPGRARPRTWPSSPPSAKIAAMPSSIERASSGRAKCRVCSQVIARGELRFGEALPNAYGEGESHFWFHLMCAACARPEPFLEALAASEESPNDRYLLESLARAGVAQPRLCRLARAERSPSGRARCRKCRELIESGTLRLGLQIFEEGRFSPLGYIHAACAAPYFEAQPEVERLGLPGGKLSRDELDEVARAMRSVPFEGTPGLAKAQPESPKSTRKSS